MENKTIPYLCGGTFFTLLLKARKATKSPNELVKGQKESFSEQNLLMRLISIYRSTDFYQGGDTPKTYTSDFKRCKKNINSFIGFDDRDRFRIFYENIQKENSKAFADVQKLITDFFDESLYETLVRNLLGLIQEDRSISDYEKFFIPPKEITKKELIKCSEINLPALLLGVWDFIADKRSDMNCLGEGTYASWYPNKGKEYKGKVGDSIKQNLKITTTPLSTPLELNPVDSQKEEQNQEYAEVHESNESSNKEEKNYSKTQIIQNATIVNQNGEKNIHINHVDILNL